MVELLDDVDASDPLEAEGCVFWPFEIPAVAPTVVALEAAWWAAGAAIEFKGWCCDAAEVLVVGMGDGEVGRGCARLWCVCCWAADCITVRIASIMDQIFAYVMIAARDIARDIENSRKKKPPPPTRVLRLYPSLEKRKFAQTH